MSYLVLARKYRPQRFAEIVGQEHVTRTLTNAIAQGRLHHAFLFTGARGVGKTTAARILAKALSCEKAPTAEPCNQCEACVEITQGTSVDVQEIDAASHNGVEHIRDLREAIRYAPVRGKKKVYILDEVHMLSGSAWNALLKTLEEPPPHAVFVFATTDPHKIPATILSRVQRYDFKLVAARRIVEHLHGILDAEKVPHDRAALALIAREAGGSVRDSLSLLDQVLATIGDAKLGEETVAGILGVADRALIEALEHAVLSHDAEAALIQIDAAFERGYDLSQLCHTFLAHLRDLAVLATVKNAAPLVDWSEEELSRGRARLVGVAPGLLEALFDRFSRITDDVARSPLPRYALEIGVIELARTEALEPLGALVQKLEALETRVESGIGSSGAGPSGSARGPRGPDAPPRQEPRPPPHTKASTPATTTATPAAPPAATAPIAPATAAAPTPAAAPRTWTELVERLLDRAPRLSGLALGRLLSWTDERLIIGFDKEFDADHVRSRLELLQGALAATLGRDLAVELRVGAAEDPSRTETLIEVEQRRVDEDRERRLREALDHPVRKVLDAQFRGVWKDPVVDNLDKD